MLSYGEGEATDDFSKEIDDVYTHRSVIRALQNFPKGDVGHNATALQQHSVEEDHDRHHCEYLITKCLVFSNLVRLG